jgi:hypothetical protein
MKKMIVLTLTLVALSYAVLFGGKVVPESRLAVVKFGDVFKVIYVHPGPSQVKVTISDADGNEVYSEKLTSETGFIRPYNFSSLPKGDYKICVSDQAGEYTEKVSFRDKEGKEWKAHVVKLKTGRQRYIVTIPYQGNGEAAIQIYDEDGRLIFTDQAKLEKDFGRIYTLTNLQGKVSFRLVNESTGDEESFDAE